jgi:hypothetical protein
MKNKYWQSGTILACRTIILIYMGSATWETDPFKERKMKEKRRLRG